MNRHRLVEGVLKRSTFLRTEEHSKNNSSALLLQTSLQDTRKDCPTRRTGSNFVMAFRKLKYCTLLQHIQRLVTIGILVILLDHATAEARKFQGGGDVTTNIITDAKSVASIDFR